jgi:hypothetical protein
MPPSFGRRCRQSELRSMWPAYRCHISGTGRPYRVPLGGFSGGWDGFASSVHPIAGLLLGAGIHSTRSVRTARCLSGSKSGACSALTTGRRSSLLRSQFRRCSQQAPIAARNSSQRSR